MNIKYLDLFSGIGGFREALRKTTKHNGIRSTCVGFSEIDENAIRTYRSNFEKYPEEKELGDISKITTLPEDSDIRNKILISNQIPHSTVLYRKDMAEKVGGYDEKLSCVEDLEFCRRQINLD